MRQKNLHWNHTRTWILATNSQDKITEDDWLNFTEPENGVLRFAIKAGHNNCLNFWKLKQNTHTKERGSTDSSSWPMLTIWDIEGDADAGIFGMKRDISATDDILIASSSTRELAEKSYAKRTEQMVKHLLVSPKTRLQDNAH